MNHRFKAYLYLLLVSFIWGVAGPVIKYTLRDFPPLIFLSYRFALSTLFALASFIFIKPHFPKAPQAQLSVLLYGFLTSTISLGLLFLGFDKTTSLTGTLLSATAPIMISVAGVLFLQEHVTRTERIGLGIAFLGTLFILLEPFLQANGTPRLISFEGNMLVLASLAVGVVTAIMAKMNLRNNVSPVTLTNVSFIIGFLTILPITILMHPSGEIATTIFKASIPMHLGVWYMAFVSGTLAYTLWHKAEKTIEVGEVALISYLYPVWAMPFSVYWLGEKLTLPFVTGGIIIAVGVFIAEHKRRTKKKILRKARLKSSPHNRQTRKKML